MQLLLNSLTQRRIPPSVQRLHIFHQVCSTSSRRLLPMPKLLCSGNQPIGLFAIANTPQSKPTAGTTRGYSRRLELYGMQLASLIGNLELPASQSAVYDTLLSFCTDRGQSHNDNCALRLLFFVVETKEIHHPPGNPAITRDPQILRVGGQRVKMWLSAPPKVRGASLLRASSKGTNFLIEET